MRRERGGGGKRREWKGDRPPFENSWIRPWGGRDER